MVKITSSVFWLIVFGVTGACSQAWSSMAILHTTYGDIEVELYDDKAPQTVANFIGLALGKKQWRDPRSPQRILSKPLYNGTIFHRIAAGFMVQGGDPLGNGWGGPGYVFADEFVPDLNFTKPGLLAMANSGPNTNGSQFFLTVGTPLHLNQKHTIFGEVKNGYKVLENISLLQVDAQSRPVRPPMILSIEIRQGTNETK
jgi:peptidyl-prolyl cis-trans isomerase A (cyclophilin A)